jgi:hypothetical protein
MDDAPLTPLSEKDAPKTFAERGAAVPLTTPALMWSRVRQQTEHIKELLVPGLANTRGIYVFEWGGISQRFTLTLHDRMLHKALAPEKNPTPTVVARIANKIALGGSAGPEVQAAAQRKQKDAENLVMVARYTLIMRAIERMSRDGSTTNHQELSTTAGQQRAKQILTRVAGTIPGLSAKGLDDRIEALARLLGDVGMVGMPIKAPMRQLLQRMGSMSRVLDEWANEGRGEATTEARLISRVAQATMSIAEDPLAVIDGSTRGIEQILRQWDSTNRAIGAAVERLSWLLDGWDRLTNMWLDVTDRNASEQSRSLEYMSYMLPMIPARELRPEDAEKWHEMGKTLYAQCRSADTPQTGGVDLEMMLRLEGHRVRENPAA